MWVYNNDFKKWGKSTDSMLKSDFDYLKQELSATRFYSKFLSGSTYVPISDVNDIYDILGKWVPRNWYIGTVDSKYSISDVPARFSKIIDNSTSYEYYTKFISEYGLTLKNLFTSARIIKDSIDNYIHVYVATINSIDLNLVYNSLTIDGVVLKSGNLILVKDQVTNISLSNTVDPNVYLNSNYRIINDLGTIIEYEYYNYENGIYLYDGRTLIKQNNLSDYKKCIRMSVYVEAGTINSGKQFHLSRLLNGYFPTSLVNDGVEFKEKKNWLLRNRVDYNNLFEINYFDVIKEGAHSYYSNGVTYSIPERTISVGEFGVILNNQFGTSNIIPNKYKVNLRSISKTTTDYWICGDDTTILKVRKHDFDINLVKIDSLVKLSSISFFDDLRGVVVGDQNTILLTTDAGQSWKRLKIDDFASFTYNKVLFSDFNRIYIIGRNGIFLEIVENINGWTAYRRRISKQIDEDDDYLLVENINDMYRTTVDNWNLLYSYNTKTTSVNKELLFFVTDNNNIIAHDINDSTDYDFLYLDLGKDYGDILNITKKTSSDIFYFTSNDGLYSFDITDFKTIGIGNSYSNAISGTYATYESSLYANEIFDYKGEDLLLAGNTSLLKSATYSSPINFKVLDSDFESRLKPKLLFMDYDMGSKLNFFTDQGEYRLPNSATFSLTDTSASTILTFSSDPSQSNLPIYDNVLLPSKITITNNAASKIKVSDLRVKLNITHAELYSISISLRKASNPGSGKIITLMPNNVAGPNADFVNFTFTTNPYYNKFSNLLYPYSNKTASMLTKTDNSGNFYAAFRDVANANNIVYANSSDFSEMIKITTGSSAGTYDIAGDWELLIYDWTNSGLTSRKLNSWEISFVKDNSTFSISPIVHSATGPSYLTQSEVTWWNYWSDREKTFEYWTNNTISDSSAILANSTFTSYDSYSSIFPKELSINRIDTSDTELLKLAPSFKYSGSKNSSRFDSNLGPPILTNIVPPNVSGTNRMYLKDYLMILEIDTRWSVDKGDVIRLESDIIDNNFIVNKIITSQAYFSPVVLGNRKFVYMYSEFNENIINELVVLSKSGGSIKVRNLNKYNSIDNLISNFNYHPLSNAYYATQSSGIISVSPKFNPITSYYNLGTSVNFNGLTSSMSYTDSFLKFGYSPRYNLIDYLEAINTSLTNPSFYATKEYLAMPVYKGLPIATDSLNADNVYIDKSGLNAIDGGTASVVNDHGNRLVLGPNLKLEWESIFVNTFVDVSIYHAGSTNGTYSVNKLLVLNKYKAINYKDSGIDPYIIEFDKSIKFDKGKIFATGSTVDIVSRRTLKQISDDLQELNNIQRPKSKIAKMDGVITSTYSNYDSDLNFKLSTDSYAKVLLSDVNTVKELSAIMYTDYKNEIAMNVTRLDRSYSIPISNTIDYYGQLYINCSEKHGLVLADGLVLEFNGGTFSSEYLNQQYFGYHFVRQVINEYDFIVEIPYGNPIYIGNDTGFVKYLRKDPFFNYQPVDLIEVGLNKKGNVAIKLDPDNVKLTGSTFSLTNVNYNRYRYKLLDGLTLDSVNLRFPWLLEAEVTDAVVGLNDYSELVWYKGVWESGRWFGGNWISGTWKYGDWYGGTWNSQNIIDKGSSVDVDLNSSGSTQSVWFTGRWYDGTWNDGTWVNGRWYGGTWERGIWNNGTWNDGTWNYGKFIGGIWVAGTWNDGIFNTDNEQSFWINGEWNGGDFENGIWYNGFFGEDNSPSRFGTNAYNSRTAIWYGGKWKSGSFYSKLTNNDVSDVHKYSIWYSGQWMSGDFRGGIAYNMTFNSGTWHGGILEEIQLIGINSSNNSFILNGLFKFNIGDEIYIIDNNLTNEYSKYGSNVLPVKYTVLYVVENTTTRLTEVYVDMNIDTTNLASYKKNSGLLNLSIPNNSTQIISTQSVPYNVTTTNEIRLKLNLTNNYISDLIINLKAPNGDFINIKEYGAGGSQYLTTPSGVASPSPYTSMVDTIFTTDASNDFKFGEFLSSTYTETYEMSKSINQGYLQYKSSTNDYRVLLSNGSVKGDWVLYVKDNHKDLTNQIGSTGLMHSSNYAIHLTYVNIGDNFKIVLQKPNSYNPDLRIGDNIVIDIIGHSPASNLISANSNTAPVLYTLSTYISGISNINTGTMHITTGLTASTVISSYFSGSSGLLPPAASIYNRSYANIYSSSNPRSENKLIDWEIQFVNDYEVGAQIDYKKEDGFDTGLRVVSKFKNANWKSGIWTNGIYDNGVFEGGVWYNGVFNGTWG
jgi:subtilisin-like proprotein convertase family protein